MATWDEKSIFNLKTYKLNLKIHRLSLNLHIFKLKTNYTTDARNWSNARLLLYSAIQNVFHKTHIRIDAGEK